MRLLLTGGAGYIGSHVLLACLRQGLEVTVIDSLVNGSREAVRRAERLAGRPCAFIEGDLRDSALLERTLREREIEAVLHFAGLKAVAESFREPLAYYGVNVAGTLSLCGAMRRAGVFTLIFSSSATVYGAPPQAAVSEDHPTGQVAAPYGRSKWMVEQILDDLAASDASWRIGMLRYFNPVGADASGQIGEDPAGIPTNLVPYVAQVAIGRLPLVNIFGTDYPTPDGTAIRDYIHVSDLADAHLAALAFLRRKAGSHVWNIATGTGYSVREVVRAFAAVSGRDIPCVAAPRRPGDAAFCAADPEKARRELGWSAKFDLARMMEDHWRWQSLNPCGYDAAQQRD